MNMDLQTRKFKAIEYLVRLKDEETFSIIESTIREVEKQQNKHQTLKPFTVEQLIERASESSADYLSGRYTYQEQIEKESDNW